MPLQLALRRPPRGGSTRLQFGRTEVVLEATRGGYALLWLEGRQARRFALGLGPTSELSVALAAPRLPVRVAARDTLALAPRARLRGYVQVPLVPTISCRDHAGVHRLAEFPPAELEPEWDDREGTVWRCVSPFHVRYPIPGSEPRVTVAVWLANPTETIASPAYLPLVLADADLRPVRGGVGARPRRLTWNGQGLVATAAGAASVTR
ncbi:MAG: hypothetical protein KF830_13445 [Planctomycetes bacterium]|nr:hypothetical protein [Planctomycetota bacterium]